MEYRIYRDSKPPARSSEKSYNSLSYVSSLEFSVVMLLPFWTPFWWPRTITQKAQKVIKELYDHILLFGAKKKI